MGILYKQGVDGSDLKRPIRKLLIWLHDRFGGAIVTSTTESAAGRRSDSLHYIGMALDIRDYTIRERPWNGMSAIKAITKKDLVELCGPGFDVVQYEGFFHIEWDPK